MFVRVSRLRSVKADQPNGDIVAELNAEALSPRSSILGSLQRKWLEEALAASSGTLNVLAQQGTMGMVDLIPGEPKRYSMDQWPGYAHERMALVKFMADRKVRNPMVLTGDIHSNWVNDLHVDDRKANRPVIATKFVGTSITSGGNETAGVVGLEFLRHENPGVRFHNGQRGYVRCTVTPATRHADYIGVPDVSVPGGVVASLASFVVEAGRPGAKPA